MAKGTLAQRVSRLRGVAGISARDLDRLAELVQGHTSAIEAGGRDGIAAQTVSKIARVFGASMDWLFAGTGAAPSDDDVRDAVAKAKRAVKRTLAA